MSDNKELLSVIIPVYKVELFLRRCVDSILSQSYKNIEIILVDDGSPDNCPIICDEYAELDSRVRVVHKENGGLCSARNAGLQAARGKYVTFVDSDDYIEPASYSAMMRYMLENEIDMIGGGYRYFRPWKKENKMLEISFDGEYREYSSIEALEKLFFGSQMFEPICIMVWNKIYRKSLFDELKFPEGYIHEDTLVTPLLIDKSSRIGVINQLVYTYNIHLGSSSTSGMAVQNKIRSTVAMSKRVYLHFKDSNHLRVVERVKNIYINSLLNGFYISCLNSFKDREWRSFMRECMVGLRDVKKFGNKNNYDRPFRIYCISPSLYLVMKYLTVKSKDIIYNVRRRITGKN